MTLRELLIETGFDPMVPFIKKITDLTMYATLNWHTIFGHIGRFCR